MMAATISFFIRFVNIELNFDVRKLWAIKLNRDGQKRWKTKQNSNAHNCEQWRIELSVCPCGKKQLFYVMLTRIWLLVCIHHSFGFVTKTKFQLTKKRKYSISELFECSRMQTRVKQKHSYRSLAAKNVRSEGKASKSGQRNEILH